MSAASASSSMDTVEYKKINKNSVYDAKSVKKKTLNVKNKKVDSNANGANTVIKVKSAIPRKR